MFEKLKHSISNKPKKQKISQIRRMDGTPVKEKQKPSIQDSPKVAVIVMIAAYFMLDYLMMESVEYMYPALTVVFTLLAPLMMFGYYANNYHKGTFPEGGTEVPRFIKDKRKYVLIGWAVITILGVLLLILEPFVVPKFFPVLDTKYYSPQIMLMVYIAPIMEETAYRYLLYDRWFRPKLGWFFGFLAASFIFVLTHPVTNLHSLIIYWAPTLMFFLIYHEFGLYGSIAIHMLYNLFAI